MRLALPIAFFLAAAWVQGVCGEESKSSSEAVEAKTEPPKPDTPKADPPPAEPPKTDPLKTDPPKTDPPKVEPVPAAPAAFKFVELSDLPDLKNETEEHVTKSGKVNVSGLVSTVNYEEFKEPKLEGDEKIKLPKEVTGFRDDIEVRVLWQNKKAPLAIPLLGFYSKCDDKLAKTWMAYLHSAGCHVIVFDSIFRANFNERVGLGVPGNLREEAQAVAKIVDTILKFRPEKETTRIGEKVSGVRLLGTSYGGILALTLLKLPQAKTWPVERTLVLSAPVRMQTAAERVDACYRIDRPKFEISLIHLMGGYTPDTPPTPRQMALMRAGIAYDFYDALGSILDKNEKLYMPGLFERFKAEEDAREPKVKFEARLAALKQRQDKEMEALKKSYEAFKDDKQKKEEYKAKKKDLEDKQKVEENDQKKRLGDPSYWTYKDFVEHFCAPYWKLKPEEIWAQGDLGAALQEAPGNVQVIVAADDPLNKPEELKALQEKFHNPKFIVIPNGGHLGFCGTKWCEELLKKFFAP
ncbi:MAG: alpha/beta fold hydrolase [Planctomycetes bacterium]|nr:alpha/beta fold hydrolase [Planctomycetota bacterium]